MEYAVLTVAIAVMIVAVICLLEINGIKRSLADNKNGDIIGSAVETTRYDIKETKDALDKEINETRHSLDNEINAMRQETIKFMDQQFAHTSMQNEQKLENIRKTMENSLRSLTEDNNKQLEMMRNTVDKKLQKTLEDRISQSFKLVSERLEQVYKGLGEMQTLAAGVGDLKKVLSNVKNRGILGEIQLGSIFEQILAPDQYEENVKTTSGNERVEFAVKLPGDGNETVYLPIDAKFPGDTYSNLMDAYEAGDKAGIEDAGKKLDNALKKAAKDIHDKYIEPPNTTDFGIMFLPFEGLYAEVVRRGLVEELQRSYKVNISGPTTMSAMLNSLQMGFRTLAIQKHSGEVWNMLSAVKTEFGKFGDVLASTQKKLEQANKDLEKLVGTRTRMIYSKLKNVETMSLEDSELFLDLPGKDAAGDMISGEK